METTWSADGCNSPETVGRIMAIAIVTIMGNMIVESMVRLHLVTSHISHLSAPIARPKIVPVSPRTFVAVRPAESFCDRDLLYQIDSCFNCKKRANYKVTPIAVTVTPT